MAEPILWANHAKRTQPAMQWNPDLRAFEPVIDPDTGEPRLEKIPQRAHDGDGDPFKPKSLTLVHATWIHYLRHDGHCVRVKLTNAAADLDVDQKIAKYHQAKARWFGWIPLSACPCALRVGGQISQAQLRSDDAKHGDPCPPGSHSETRPCPHLVAERAVRQAARKKIQAARDLTFQPEAEKLLRGQQQQTNEIVSALTEVVKALAGQREPLGTSEQRAATVVKQIEHSKELGALKAEVTAALEEAESAPEEPAGGKPAKRR